MRNVYKVIVFTFVVMMAGLGPVAAKCYSPAQVKQMVQDINASTKLNLPVRNVMAFVSIESSFCAREVRYEKHLRDSSVGLMQTMTKTAKWLHDDMGYRDFPRPTTTRLKDAKTSLYYGMAYVDYLRRQGGGWSTIARKYNGGNQGHRKKVTLQYWHKYSRALARL